MYPTCEDAERELDRVETGFFFNDSSVINIEGQVEKKNLEARTHVSLPFVCLLTNVDIMKIIQLVFPIKF